MLASGPAWRRQEDVDPRRVRGRRHRRAHLGRKLGSTKARRPLSRLGGGTRRDGPSWTAAAARAGSVPRTLGRRRRRRAPATASADVIGWGADGWNGTYTDEGSARRSSWVGDVRLALSASWSTVGGRTGRQAWVRRGRCGDRKTPTGSCATVVVGAPAPAYRDARIDGLFPPGEGREGGGERRRAGDHTRACRPTGRAGFGSSGLRPRRDADRWDDLLVGAPAVSGPGSIPPTSKGGAALPLPRRGPDRLGVLRGLR
jgi:hypothetical protein